MSDPVELDYVDRPDWYSGPPPPMTRGPVLTAYVDTHALDYDCINPTCLAKAGQFCRHDAEHGGKERKMPCPTRIKTAAQARGDIA
jgi:hypothetical protein